MLPLLLGTRTPKFVGSEKYTEHPERTDGSSFPPRVVVRRNRTPTGSLSSPNETSWWKQKSVGPMVLEVAARGAPDMSHYRE